MRLLNEPNDNSEVSALQQAVNLVESQLAALELRLQEVAAAKKHVISDRNRPKGDCYYSGAWVQKQRQSRIEYRFRIELLKEAIEELADTNRYLSQTLETTRELALELPWEEVETAESYAWKADPQFCSCALNVLMADELRSTVAARLFKACQELENARSNTPDNFHTLWGSRWLKHCLVDNKRTYTCRFRHSDEALWLYLSSEHSDYLYGDGRLSIPNWPCMTRDQAVAVSEKLVLEIWNNWRGQIIVEIYDIERGTGSKHLLSDATQERLSAPPEQPKGKDKPKAKPSFWQRLCGETE
jgi:hypothetical protein